MSGLQQRVCLQADTSPDSMPYEAITSSFTPETTSFKTHIKVLHDNIQHNLKLFWNEIHTLMH